MVEDISRTLKKKSLDGIFNEVVHNEKLGISNNEELHLFYLAVRGNKFYTEDLQTALYGRNYSPPGVFCIKIMADTCIRRGKHTNYGSIFY